jgi:hypothetical protein
VVATKVPTSLVMFKQISEAVGTGGFGFLTDKTEGGNCERKGI